MWNMAAAHQISITEMMEVKGMAASEWYLRSHSVRDVKGIGMCGASRGDDVEDHLVTAALIHLSIMWRTSTRGGGEHRINVSTSNR